MLSNLILINIKIVAITLMLNKISFLAPLVRYSRIISYNCASQRSQQNQTGGQKNVDDEKIQRERILSYQRSLLQEDNQLTNNQNSTNSFQTNFKEEDLKKINEVNKYFEGVRINTKYRKFYSQDKLENILYFNQRRSLADLPFKGQKQPSSDLKLEYCGKKLAKFILSKVSPSKLKEKLQEMSTNYFNDIIKETRNTKIEPNFQREARRTISYLKKSGYVFKINNSQDSYFKIVGCELYKGLQVTRNNNYSIDSYQIIQNPLLHRYYKLWQKGAYKIPEQQWNTRKNLLMRIFAHVKVPLAVEVFNKDKLQVSTKDLTHTFVFEMNLRPPPRFSQFSLSQKQYIKIYQPSLDNLTITNVDQRNPFYAFTYEEYQKKSKLINKLV